MRDNELDKVALPELLERSIGARTRVKLAKLAKRFGGSLRSIAAASDAQLAKVGLDRRHIARLRLLFELARRYAETPWPTRKTIANAGEVFEHYRERLGDATQEHFYVIALDAHSQVLDETLIGMGTSTTTLCHPREVFAPALRTGASAVIVVHNHPTGNPAPSSADIANTLRLCAAGQVLGIIVLDHIIVGKGSFAALSETCRAAQNIEVGTKEETDGKKTKGKARRA